jgi:exodeoxyribonuclease X
MEHRIIVLDTETASLEGGIVDIAMVEIDDNLNEIDRLESLIDPERPISFSAMGVHHITESMVASSPTIGEFIACNGNPFDHPNLIVVGHNIKFDLKVVSDLLPQVFQSIDTLRLARQVYPEAENHKLQTLRYMLDLEAGEPHRAMGDVITCLSLLRRVAKDSSITGFQGLLDMMKQTISPDCKMPFGKHAGMKLRDVPSGWVGWYLGQPDNDPDLREAFLAIRNNPAR